MKKIWLLALIIGVVLAIAAILYFKVVRKSEVVVDIEAVGRRSVKSTIVCFGRITPRTDVEISAQVTGKIKRLLVDEGDTVKRSDTLVILDQSQYSAEVDRLRANLRSTQANLKQVEANLAKARDNLEKMRSLYSSGAVSKDALVEAETQVAVLEAQYSAAKESIESAQAALRQSVENLNQTVILSPIDGVVTSLKAETGEFVVVGTMNNPGSVIMTISQLSELLAEVSVDEADVVNVRVGQKAKVELEAFPDTFFDGRVVQVSKRAASSATLSSDSEARATFEVKIAIDNPDPRTLPGMSVTATIETSSKDSVLAIPLMSVVSYPDPVTGKIGEGVFVYENGTVTKKPVKLGISGEQYSEVVEGLSDNDTIITGPLKVFRTLEDGTKVKARRAEAKKHGTDFGRGGRPRDGQGRPPFGGPPPRGPR